MPAAPHKRVIHLESILGTKKARKINLAARLFSVLSRLRVQPLLTSKTFPTAGNGKPRLFSFLCIALGLASNIELSHLEREFARCKLKVKGERLNNVLARPSESHVSCYPLIIEK